MSRINTNVSSLIAQTRLSRSNNQLQESLTRLSTGLRINSGKDDPAGLIASETLRADITSTNKAISNSDRANNLIATADAALGQISNLLNDIRGLVVEAANEGVLSDDQIAANQLQVDSSLEAIDRIAQVTTFQGRKLLDGSLEFLTNVTSGASTISDLNIQQANLGAAGQVNVSVNITAAAQQALITNNSINFSAGVAAAGTITFADTAAQQASTTAPIALTNTGGGAAFNISAVAGGLADGTVGNSTSVVLQSSPGIVQASGNLTFAATASSNFDITAVAGSVADGTAGNINVVLQAGGSTAVASFSGGVLTVDVAAGATITDIANAIDAHAGFEVSNVTGGAAVHAAGDLTTYNAVTTGGDNGTTSASYNSTTNQIIVNVAAGATVNQIVAQINGLADFDAAVTGGGTEVYNHADNATLTSIFSGGADATDADVITITSTSTGTAYNGTLNFVRTSSVAAGGVQVQVAGANITVSVNDNSAYNLATLASTIQSQLTGYTVALTGTSGDGTYSSATDEVTTSNLAGGTNDGGTGLGADVTFKLSGVRGSEVFDFNAGSTLNEILTAINLVQDATGVQAVNNAGVLELRSTEYGRSAFVDVEVISEGTGGTFESSLTTNRATGTDIQATVNGIQAKGKGNNLALNTASLDLNLTVAAGSSSAITFSIFGGGALFQLGPEVVSNQQARIGIGSVNTAKLGGVNGRLYELRSGNAADLSTDTKRAANIVSEVITKVTELRGRLGAFQRTTLETNIASLNDTLSNLTAAESAIRDADFAAESAKLTRAQILTQAGTAVLQIANQNPQSVLALLRG
jgi:flagellin